MEDKNSPTRTLDDLLGAHDQFIRSVRQDHVAGTALDAHTERFLKPVSHTNMG